MKENEIKAVSEGAFERDDKEKQKIKKNNKYLNLLGRFTAFPIYLVVILLPLFFINNIPSPFELNKQMILVGLVGVSFLIWVGGMAWKNEIRFKKSFLVVPILTFALIYSLSTVFSNYYEQSMWGYFGGESMSLVSVVFFIAFFILIYNNIDDYKGVAKYIFSFLLSGLIISVFSVLQFFKIYLLPFEYTQEKFFNPIGPAYLFSFFIAVVFIVSISLFLSNVSKLLKASLLLLSIFSFFILILINFKIVFVVLLFMLALILGLTILIEDKKPSQSRIVPMIFLVLTLFLILRSTSLFDNSELPVEVFIKHRTAIEISLDSIRDNPLLGSGPTTFSDVYKQNRPSNLGDFASINFNNSTSFFLTLVSTTGILGSLSFIFVVLSGTVVLFRNFISIIKKGAQGEGNLYSYLNVAISVAWIFLTISLFIYVANITTLLLWWFFFALMTSMTILREKKENNEIATTSNNPKSSFVLSFGFVLVIVALIAVVYLQSQKYMAAVYFQQAVKANNLDADLERTADRISRAVSLDPNRDVFYRDLAIVHLSFAKEKIIEKGIQDLTPEESAYVSDRFRSALQSLNIAKELNPKNSLNLISVANLYEEFIVIQEEAGDKAIENYEKAVELDPKNPEIYQSMANVQIALADLSLIGDNSQKDVVEMPEKGMEKLVVAEKYLEKALEIKPDHVGANLLLAIVYEKKGEIDKATEKALKNIEIFPNSAELYVDLGRIYYEQEMLSEAEGILREGLRVNSKYANALYLLGLVLDQAERKDEALEAFRKIEENNPDNELLQSIIKNLENGRSALFGMGNNQVEENLIQGKEEEEAVFFDENSEVLEDEETEE